MSKGSETNHDLLERVRETLEKTPEAPKQEPEKTASRSPEQLLELLRQKMGDESRTVPSSRKRDDDYDVSGYEIEPTEEEEPEASDSVAIVEEPEIAVEEVAEETTETEEEDLPWETEANVIPQPPERTETQAETDGTPTHGEESVAPVSEVGAEESVTAIDAVSEEPEHDESEDGESVPFEDPEAVKKQIERFVENSMAAEDEVDYFARLDRRSERQKESVETIEPESPSNVVSASSDETDSQPIDLEEITPEIPAETDPTFKRFFFKKGAEGDTKATAETGNAASKLDETDVNLLLALGKKQNVEEAVGFVRVREAKNNFFDPTDDEHAGSHTFAYNGEEYRSHEQNDAIKTRYRKAKRSLWWRFASTLLLALLLLTANVITVVPITIPVVSDLLKSSVSLAVISLIVTVCAVLISLKSILYGARGFLTLRPNRYTPLSAIVFLNLIYDATALLFLADAMPENYNIAIVIFLVVSIIGDVIRLSKERLTFEIISSEKEKFSLEKAELSASVCREEKVILTRDLLVEKVSFVGKYFQRTAKRPVACTEYFIELLATLVAASFVAIGTAILQKDYSASLNAFMGVLVVCMPMQHLLGSYPFARLAKILYRHESAIIGETIDKEYVGASTVYLDDIEVFGHHGVSVSGLRTYNDANFYEVLYHALAVFSRMEGPLRHVFDSSSQEIEEAKSVEIVKIYADGIEALVDGVQRVLIGTLPFMESNGYSPAHNDDDERRVESGDFSILYMSVNGELHAKFYMKYTITKRFETFVSEMNENGTAVGIRTLDPGITERMIARLHGEDKQAISVIRPTLNDLVPIGRRSDSGIVTAKNSHIFSRILTLCGRLKRVNGVCVLLRIISMVVGLLAIIPVILFGRVHWISGLFVALYQLMWLLPSTVYTGTKLK